MSRFLFDFLETVRYHNRWLYCQHDKPRKLIVIGSPSTGEMANQKNKNDYGTVIMNQDYEYWRVT